tara:strand:- start:2341 stop:2685 length:345 start_codon:yes stop_codon:yes gene_type:complete
MTKDEHYKQRSKDRLSISMQKKVKTTMIGSLSSIEEHFGFLWGHDSEAPLTTQQEDFKQAFELLRSEILDKGNTQIRNVEAELATYDVTWNRYRYQIPVTSVKFNTVTPVKTTG